MLFVVMLSMYRSYYCPRVVRTIWYKPRSREWWKAVQSGTVPNSWWRENLRMSKETLFVCEKMRPYIQKEVC